MLRKTSAAAAIIAFATVGSALFGGAALANDGNGNGNGERPPLSFEGGDGGHGGDVWQECKQDAIAYNVVDDSLVGDDVNQDATADNSCIAIGGDGGNGGDGVDVDKK
jgi:hypothetical protein